MKAIEYIVEYKFSMTELSLLDDDLAAALAVSCYAVSEINALMRLYLYATHDFIENDVIDTVNAIQRSVILRTWSAKLFEFSEFINLKGQNNKTDNAELIELAKQAQTTFESLKHADGYRLARDLRHEASNHYSLRPAKKNLQHVSENANMSLYLHNKNGNSFYPMGEEVMFVARVNRHATSAKTKEEKTELYDTWMDWNLKASKWLGDTHRLFVKSLVLDRFPDRTARKVDHWIPLEMVGEVGQVYTPLFTRKDIYDRKKTNEDE